MENYLNARLRLAIFFNLSTPIHWTFVICIEEHV